MPWWRFELRVPARLIYIDKGMTGTNRGRLQATATGTARAANHGEGRDAQVQQQETEPREHWGELEYGWSVRRITPEAEVFHSEAATDTRAALTSGSRKCSHRGV